MRVDRLWLDDFRSYHRAELTPAPGLTVVTGDNGEGKTNLLEAVGYLATLRSFRGATGDALVREGAEVAVLRAEGHRDARSVLIEAEVSRTGRDRAQLNRQPVRRQRDLHEALVVSVFTPDDSSLVKGGPGERRRYLDDLLVALHPRHDSTQADLERILKQRNALLKGAVTRGARGAVGTHPEVSASLDVWDARMAEVGSALVRARRGLTDALGPGAQASYGRLGSGAAGRGRATVTLEYRPSWVGSLADALALARAEDLRRGVSTVGPQRDELALAIGGLPARTHASQGEQRSLALALRLAGHHLLTGRLGAAPILLLDDVFSELDGSRAAALLDDLPPGQALLTTAGPLPPGARPDLVVRADHTGLRVVGGEWR